MKLEKHLTQKKDLIVGRWLDLIFETYPADSQRFLRKQKDRFANPVGTTITKEIENLYDELIKGLEPERISALLDRIIRFRTFLPPRPSPSSFISKKPSERDCKKRSLKTVFRKTCRLWSLE